MTDFREKLDEFLRKFGSRGLRKQKADLESFLWAWLDEHGLELVNLMAHLTTTPLALAMCDLKEVPKSIKDPHSRKKIAVILARLEEANKAISRAYLFECTPETRSVFVLEAGELISAAAKEAKINIRGELPEVLVKGNRFRLWFAFRDLFAFAVMADGTSSCSVQIQGNARLLVTILVPGLEWPHPDRLFDTAYRIEVRESGSDRWFNPELSLLLAKRLLAEAGGTIDVDGSKGLKLKITLPVCQKKKGD